MLNNRHELTLMITPSRNKVVKGSEFHLHTVYAPKPTLQKLIRLYGGYVRRKHKDGSWITPFYPYHFGTEGG